MTSELVATLFNSEEMLLKTMPHSGQHSRAHTPANTRKREHTQTLAQSSETLASARLRARRYYGAVCMNLARSLALALALALSHSLLSLSHRWEMARVWY